MLTDFYQMTKNGTFPLEDYHKMLDFYIEYHKDYKFEMFKYELPDTPDYEKISLNDLRNDEIDVASGFDNFVVY